LQAVIDNWRVHSTTSQEDRGVQVPPPEESGVEVNLGNSDQGTGNIQPEVPAVQQSSAPKPMKSNNDYMTQNVEESTSLTKKTTKPDPKVTPQETVDNTPKVDPTKIYNPKKTQGGSQGETGLPGDQGKQGGDPNSNNYTGTPGSGGTSPSFNVGNRSTRKITEPKYVGQEQGQIVVKVWVDQKGQVIKAQAGEKGTNISNTQQKAECERAAMNTTFDVSPDAPPEQIGTITYQFKKQN